jgi:hypothetical protein
MARKRETWFTYADASGACLAEEKIGAGAGQRVLHIAFSDRERKSNGKYCPAKAATSFNGLAPLMESFAYVTKVDGNDNVMAEVISEMSGRDTRLAIVVEQSKWAHFGMYSRFATVKGHFVGRSYPVHPGPAILTGRALTGRGEK